MRYIHEYCTRDTVEPRDIARFILRNIAQNYGFQVARKLNNNSPLSFLFRSRGSSSPAKQTDQNKVKIAAWKLKRVYL